MSRSHGKVISGEYSPIEHLAKTISLSSFNWQEVQLAMFTACFDASGTQHDQQFLVVAGFVSSADVWMNFDRAWKDRLSLDGLSHFHMVDFEHSQGEFKKGWRNNEPRRKKLKEDLMEIIRRHAFRKFGNVIEIKTLEKALPKNKLEEYYLNAYALGSMTCVAQVIRWCKMERIPFERVEFVFEEGDTGQDILRKRFKHDFEILPMFKGKKDKDTPNGRILGFTPIQAADWFAYEVFRGCKEMNDRKNDPRWALVEFCNILGELGIIETDNLEHLDTNHRVAIATLNRFKMFTRSKTNIR